MAESHAAPGILYYDPNSTTAKLATASLRLAGYAVYNCNSRDRAVGLCEAHGPEGDGTLVALLLDASADPKLSAAVLAALVQLPGASELPGILMVSRRNPNPIPAAEGLPTVRRPFSSPALLKVIAETLATHGRSAPSKREPAANGVREQRLRALLEKHLPKLDIDAASLSTLLSELDVSDDLPAPSGDEILQANLASMPFDALLEMLANNGTRGVLSVEHGKRRGRLYLDKGRIRLADYRGGDEDLKFGRFVVEGGFMRDEELETFIVGRDPEGRPLGQRLVDGGFLTTNDLAEILVAQAREITCHLLTFQEGMTSFRPTDELHPMAVAALETSTTELMAAEALLDGLRRLDERATMGPHMPEVEDVYLRLDEQIAKIGRETLAREELGVLELINGRHNVKEVARKTRTGTFAVAKILFRLDRSSLVRKRVTPVVV